jgi:23S rRNA (adenine2503-C2)-methyltransferase
LIDSRINLLNFDPEGMSDYIASLQEKPFRAQQLMRWVHQRGEADIAQMSDLAKTFRATLAEKACVSALPVISDQQAADGTRKWLLDVTSLRMIEALCVSLLRQAVR